MRKFKLSWAALIALLGSIALPAWPDDVEDIQKALDAKFKLAVVSANKLDIEKAGSVLVLKKSSIIAVDVTKMGTYGNTYKNGSIGHSALGLPIGSQSGGQYTYNLVAGTKVWVTGIEAKQKDVIFHLLSDFIDGVRYRASLKFPFEKGSDPTVKDTLAKVAEVFDVEAPPEPEPAQTAKTVSQPAPVPPPPAEPPPPPVAPPPPPAAEPAQIKMGQTPQQVVSSFGKPDKIANLGAKQVYYYKDMKVIFVGGKVSDVQ